MKILYNVLYKSYNTPFNCLFQRHSAAANCITGVKLNTLDTLKYTVSNNKIIYYFYITMIMSLIQKIK